MIIVSAVLNSPPTLPHRRWRMIDPPPVGAGRNDDQRRQIIQLMEYK